MKYLITLLLGLVLISCEQDYEIVEVETTKHPLKTDTIYAEASSVPYKSAYINVYLRSGEKHSRIFANDELIIEAIAGNRIEKVTTEIALNKAIQLAHSPERYVYWFADTVDIKPIYVTLTRKN